LLVLIGRDPTSWVLPLTLALLLVACDGEWCVAGNVGGLACEGDLLVSCPGGWGTIAFRAERIDCRAEGKYCGDNTSPESGKRAFCLPSLGACDEKSFVPYCKPHDAGSSQGTLVVCRHGQSLEAGGYCEREKR
jgi:hypothetical protein